MPVPSEDKFDDFQFEQQFLAKFYEHIGNAHVSDH